MENQEKSAIQEMDETIKRRKDEKLAEAVKLVNETIKEEWDAYSKIAETEEQDPVMVEGFTSRNCGAHVMIDPKPIARIFLNYNYPMIKVLGEDAPQAMWDEIAEHVGLEEAFGVDL